VHVPTFYETFDRIYDMPPDGLTTEESHFMGLVCSVMALGCMYKNLDENSPQDMGYDEVIAEG
jgi:hypothetical protein